MAMERQDYPAILVGPAALKLDDMLGETILMLRIAPAAAGAGGGYS